MIRIGVDLGGTSIKAGAVNEKGEILSKVSCPTRAERPYGEVLVDIARTAKAAAEKADIPWDQVERVGVGIPGIEDERTHIVPFCTNLGWHDVPARDTLRGLLGGTSVRIGNDATCAGLAEYVAGSSAGTKNSVFITLGTGVGGGIIIDGKPFTGANGVASEIGHMIVNFDGEPCTCGNVGCWERYASASALIREGIKLMEKDPEGMIAVRAEHNPENVTARLVVDAAKDGDPAASKLFDDYTYWLALGLANLVNLYDPEVFLLGGGVSAAGDFLLNPVREKLKNLVFYKKLPYARVELAVLGNDAGIIGAAML